MSDSNAGSSGSSDESILEVGDIVIDTDAYTVRLHGQTLDLTYKEFELLKYLAANQGRVLTRQALLDAVWGRGLYWRFTYCGCACAAFTRQAWR